MRHLTAAKQDGDLNFVLVLQESDRLFDLETDIVLTCLGSQTNLFGLRRVGVLVRLLFLVVLVLAVIHDPANWWSFIRRDFNEVEFFRLSFRERFLSWNDAQLFTVRRNDADGRDTDLVIDPGLYTVDLFTLS